MSREFREEAALDIPPDAWQEILTLTGRPSDNDPHGWRGHFFRAFGNLDAARAITDEQIEIHPTNSLPPDTIPNLPWIIPLMLDDEVVTRGQYRVDIHQPS
jgi:8-oxo-dGTP pyrophosphatase MutT (NUDIX family)